VGDCFEALARFTAGVGMREKAIGRTTEVSVAGIEFIPFSPQLVLLMTGLLLPIQQIWRDK